MALISFLRSFYDIFNSENFSNCQETVVSYLHHVELVDVEAQVDCEGVRKVRHGVAGRRVGGGPARDRRPLHLGGALALVRGPAQRQFHEVPDMASHRYNLGRPIIR